MKYGSRNIDSSNCVPTVIVRGQGPVQRFSSFPDSPQTPGADAGRLHQGPFSRSTHFPEKREVTTSDVNARYAEMRRKMREVMAKNGEPEAVQPGISESQIDSATDRSQLIFFDPVQATCEPVIENPTPITIIEANEAFARSLEENNSNVIVNSGLVDDDPADNFGNRIALDVIIPDPDPDYIQAYVDPLTPKDSFRF